jgi:hypothetical protein
MRIPITATLWATATADAAKAGLGKPALGGRPHHEALLPAFDVVLSPHADRRDTCGPIRQAEWDIWSLFGSLIAK